MGSGSSSPSKPPMSKEAQVILKEVKESPVVVYTKHHCGYCVRAKNDLQEDGIDFVERNLNEISKTESDGGKAFVTGLIQVTRQKTVPQIFICGKFIGGYTELHANRDNLHKLVEKCSVDVKSIGGGQKTVRPQKLAAKI